MIDAMAKSEIIKTEGGCACGSIRYQLAGKLGFSFHCQCRDCQHLSGSGHISVFICNKTSLQLTGKLTWYERVAASGNTVQSGFCAKCGSPVLNKNAGYADKLFVAAATLDDPSLFLPTKVVHREDGLSWDLEDPER
jgi:hypothetical protein